MVCALTMVRCVAVPANHGGRLPHKAGHRAHVGLLLAGAYASRGLRPTECNMSNYSSMKLVVFGVQVANDWKVQGVPVGP